METINERVKFLMQALNLSRADFAASIRVTVSFISLVCSGSRNLSDRTVNDICRVHGVDEVWLRTGVGEMFRPRTREDEITAFFADLLGPDATEFQRDFVSVLAKLPPEGWDLLEAKVSELAELQKKRHEKK